MSLDYPGAGGLHHAQRPVPRVCRGVHRERVARPVALLPVRQTQCGVNCFILDSRRVLAPAPKVLGPKHISNPDFAPF